MTRPDDDGADAPPDPWKSFRGVTAGTLILEAIVVLLALPVVGAVGGGLTPAALGYLLGLAAVLVVLAGLVIGVLGLVEADLYAVGLLILFFGGVGVAVLAGEYLIRYLSSRRPPA